MPRGKDFLQLGFGEWATVLSAFQLHSFLGQRDFLSGAFKC